jgi:RNA polymerase sigma factor (sigma-70 family)
MSNIYITDNIKALAADSNKELLPIEEYRKITRGIIKHIKDSGAYNFIKYYGDYFDALLESVIAADIHWNGMGTLHGYRKQRVIWQIGKIIRKKKTKKNRNLSLSECKFDLYYSNTQHKENFISTQEELEVVYKILDTFPGFSKNSKSFLTMKYIDNMTLEEIAARYGCSKQNVNQTIDRAIQNLRVILNVNPERPSHRQTGRTTPC